MIGSSREKISRYAYKRGNKRMRIGIPKEVWISFSGVERRTMMFERILVPLDGSPVAERAIPAVARVARAFAGSVIILSVIAPR